MANALSATALILHTLYYYFTRTSTWPSNYYFTILRNSCSKSMLIWILFCLSSFFQCYTFLLFQHCLHASRKPYWYTTISMFQIFLYFLFHTSQKASFSPTPLSSSWCQYYTRALSIPLITYSQQYSKYNYG